MDAVSIEDKFLFDLQGFLVVPGVLAPAECERLLASLRQLEAQDYEDAWQEALGPGPAGRPTREQNRVHQVRLNGLPRLDAAFDGLIDHPRALPYLHEFVGAAQLINTWSISKEQGAQPGGWHRGVPTADYACSRGRISSRMFNMVYFLTDNGAEDGCVVALPGSHKSNFELAWNDYPGLQLPGALPVVGRAGDLLFFSEAVIHDGLAKTTPGRRSNLYFNYAHAHYNVMAREPRNRHHFYLPPQVRQRFTETQLELTQWMEYARWDC